MQLVALFGQSCVSFSIIVDVYCRLAIWVLLVAEIYTTKRTMRTLMTNALAVRLNFEGRGDKVGISDMKKIMKVIIGKAF